SGQHYCNHQMALKMLAVVAEPGDADAWLMVRCFLQASSQLAGDAESLAGVRTAAIEALYCHSRRFAQPPPGEQILDAVIALAGDGSGELRRGAVQLLGRWPAAQTAEVLQTLTGDPTYSVCCVADRALAEQSALAAP